jgi:porin
MDLRVGALRCCAAVLAAASLQGASAEEGSAFKPSLVYEGAAFSSLGGGARSGSTYSSNLNVQLQVDAARALGWPDTLIYVDGLWLAGGNPGSFVGDAQGVSSISGPATARIYEAWVQKNSPHNRASLLVGLYDLNTEFYRLQSAALFFNASFGIGPEFAQSGVAGPSIFPNTSVGARFAVKPAEGTVLRLAVLGGQPVNRRDGSRRAFASGDGALVVAEAAFLDRARESTRPATGRLRLGRDAMLGEYERKLAVGAWHYTARFDDLPDVGSSGQPLERHGSSGIYAMGDRVLWKGGDSARVRGFVQSGLGDRRVNRIGAYFGAGVTGAGFAGGRPDDEAGIAVACARNGSHYMAAQADLMPGLARTETTLEATYLAQLTKWLALQPDLQYVIHPDTSRAIPNAWALQLRVEISF